MLRTYSLRYQLAKERYRAIYEAARMQENEDCSVFLYLLAFLLEARPVD